MDRGEIEAAFRALGDEIERRGIHGAKLWVCGGTVMVLEVGSREATKDIDCALRPRRELLEAAAAIAASLDLREGWLNDDASAYFPDSADDHWSHPPRRFGSLEVYFADDEMMLALKLLAGRGRLDRPDLVALLDRLGIWSEEAALRVFEDFYPDDVISQGGLATLRAALESRGQTKEG